MSPADRQPYEKLATLDRKRYERENTSYRHQRAEKEKQNQIKKFKDPKAPKKPL